MNIKKAKQIAIADLLSRLGYTIAKERGAQSWYLSPLRTENTPSFHVHTEKNIWYDFGDARGGTVIDLAVAYLEAAGQPSSVREVLHFLSELVGRAAAYQPSYHFDRPLINNTNEPKASWLLKSEKPVSHLALVRYLKERGIPLAVARQHFKEVRVQNSLTNKQVFALGFKNEDGGWELRNPFFQASIAPKTVSFIRGATAKPEGIHLFEGMMDFLSVLAREKDRPLVHDAIVLNSLSCLSHALPYIEGYGYTKLFSWMDNDPAGQKASQVIADFCNTEEGLTHYAMNTIYADCKDVNEWHRQYPMSVPSPITLPFSRPIPS